MWEGGDDTCDHIAQRKPPTIESSSTLGYPSDGGPRRIADGNTYHEAYTAQYRDICGKCGARRIDNQLGLERVHDCLGWATGQPCGECYICHLVAVFREIRRVLRSDGTAWLVIGDSYSGSPPGNKDSNRPVIQTTNHGSLAHNGTLAPGLKPKDLAMIPARVALALQADGWWIRSDIIWAKGLSFCPTYSGSVMPESVRDRPSKAHEYVFLLAKSPRYYFDQEAIREPNSPYTTKWGKSVPSKTGTAQGNGRHGESSFLSKEIDHDEAIDRYYTNGRNVRSVWAINPEPFSGVASYGSYRIASPDCPVHDYHADLARVLEYDEQQGASQFVRNPGTGGRPAQVQEGAVVSIPLDQYGPLFDATLAIPHSNGNCRTEGESRQDVIFFGIPSDRTEYKELLDHSAAMYDHNRGNNTSEDVLLNDLATCLLGQILYRIFGIVTFDPPNPKCCCHYTGKPRKSQDHFAVFPTALVEPMIKASTSERGCCARCGSPWERVIQKPDMTQRPTRSNGAKMNTVEVHISNNWEGVPKSAGQAYQEWRNANPDVTTGWRPTCTCKDAGDPIPATILDPFGGSGTTGLVADRLGRNAVLVELNPAYAEMAQARIKNDNPMFVETPKVASIADQLELLMV